MTVSAGKVVLLQPSKLISSEKSAANSGAPNGLVRQSNVLQWPEAESINEFTMSLTQETLVTLEKAADEFNQQLTQKH